MGRKWRYCREEECFQEYVSLTRYLCYFVLSCFRPDIDCDCFCRVEEALFEVHRERYYAVYVCASVSLRAIETSGGFSWIFVFVTRILTYIDKSYHLIGR